MRIRAGTVSFLFCLFSLAAAVGAEEAGFLLRPDALPETMEMDDGAVLPGGTWWSQEFDAESGLSWEARRLAPLPPETATLRRFILSEWPEAAGLAISASPGLSDKTTYPVLAATFVTGENEDTRLHCGTAVFADDLTYWFDASAHADSLSAAELEAVASSLEFVPPESGPDIRGARVYWPDWDPETADADENEVMTALILIKRGLAPEWGTDGRGAYRYDGIHMISAHGLAIHTFAFGADSPEKFTAERHIGADRRGNVYEMDIPDGGVYKEVVSVEPREGGAIPSWWGEYRDGDTTLDIGNYREGPFGMYFAFAFTVDGRVVAEGITPVEDRAAAFGGVVFFLEPGDDVVTVTPNPETPIPDDETDLTKYAGSYRRLP